MVAAVKNSMVFTSKNDDEETISDIIKGKKKVPVWNGEKYVFCYFEEVEAKQQDLFSFQISACREGESENERVRYNVLCTYDTHVQVENGLFVRVCDLTVGEKLKPYNLSPEERIFDIEVEAISKRQKELQGQEPNMKCFQTFSLVVNGIRLYNLHVPKAFELLYEEE